MNQEIPATDKLPTDSYKAKNRLVVHFHSTNHFIMNFTKSRQKKYKHRNKKNYALLDMFTLEDHKIRN